jgi:hypothetical protein
MRNYVAMIIAGDGEIEETFGPFRTAQAAERVGWRYVYKYLDPQYDTVRIGSMTTYGEACEEMDEAIQDDLMEMANNNPTGYIHGQEPRGMRPQQFPPFGINSRHIITVYPDRVVDSHGVEHPKHA